MGDSSNMDKRVKRKRSFFCSKNRTRLTHVGFSAGTVAYTCCQNEAWSPGSKVTLSTNVLKMSDELFRELMQRTHCDARFAGLLECVRAKQPKPSKSCIKRPWLFIFLPPALSIPPHLIKPQCYECSRIRTWTFMIYLVEAQ